MVWISLVESDSSQGSHDTIVLLVVMVLVRDFNKVFDMFVDVLFIDKVSPRDHNISQLLAREGLKMDELICRWYIVESGGFKEMIEAQVSVLVQFSVKLLTIVCKVEGEIILDTT